jgi:hypothetical protein
MEANISTATDLRSILDAFSQLSQPSSIPATPEFQHHHHHHQRRNSVILYHNQSCKSAPVNHILQVGLLGQMHQTSFDDNGTMTLRQLADRCVDTYFTCWVRYPLVLPRHDFMTWYASQPAPEDSLIVNALCSLVFRHAVTHHYSAGLEPFLDDPDRLHRQEEFFFGRARDALAQTLDQPPDRFTVIALTFLCIRTEPSRRHHYGGMAVSLLQQLDIYPRMLDDDDDDDDDYGLELDTRLWWYVWQIDFFHWTAGHPKITPLLQHPNQRYDQVDVPRLFAAHDPQDETTRIALLAQSHTLSLWRLQTDIISTLYEEDQAELTSEQLAMFDDRLRALDTLPHDAMARTRIRLEYNATLIILHQLFTPDLQQQQQQQQIDTLNNPTALASLKICLDAALEQLDLLAGCIRSPTQCAFDLFELRRVGQILAMASLVPGHKIKTLERHLERTLDVLAATPEGKIGTKGWTEVAAYLHAQRHHPQPKKKKTKTAAAAATTTMTPQQQLGQKPLTGLSSPVIISFAHKQQPPPRTPRPTQTFVQATCNTFDGNNQPRFRYFNPRKMNKFLFIDESR